MSAKSGLRVAALTVLGIIVIEAGISLAARWPHQFAGRGDRSRMLADFAGSGTALAAAAGPHRRARAHRLRRAAR